MAKKKKIILETRNGEIIQEPNLIEVKFRQIWEGFSDFGGGRGVF